MPLLIGSLPAPITSAPLVILIYAVLILMVASALASVVLRNLLYAIGAFAATMLLVAIVYLTIAPLLLFGLQLLVFTTVSAALLISLLRETSGLTASRVGPLSREWIIGAAAGGALFALLGVVVGATSWPVQICCALPESFSRTLTTTYVVGLWTVAILLGAAALGCGLLLTAPRLSRRGPIERPPSRRDGKAPTLPSPRGGGKTR